MLISVTLVLMMMTLFAQIFGLAGDAMNLQRAIADNDQQVRTFTTVMRADLQKRTFRTLAPYHPAEALEFSTIPFSERQGYLYLSLNDPNNAIDNLLQFTVRSTIQLENGDDTPYYGRSTGLVSGNPLISASGAAQQHIRSNSHQPEHDDGELSTNFTASSSAAEIAYFVRGHRLYRRVVLLRESLASSGSNGPNPEFTWDSVNSNPVATPIPYLAHAPLAGPTQTFNGQYRKYNPSAGGASWSDDYWSDFDHAAYMDVTAAGVMDGARMLAVRDLQNDRSGSTNPPALGLTMGSVAVGDPVLRRTTRFGFDQFTGISREFSHSDPSVTGFYFLGRFTQEETSHPDFNFPQNLHSIAGLPTGTWGNPFSYVDVPALPDTGILGPNGAVDGLEAGLRRGQDLLLSNVHAFEVELWDDRIGDFIIPGHGRSNGLGQPGDYNRLRNSHLNAGLVQVPGDPAAWGSPPYDQWTGRIFDTWHSESDLSGVVETPINNDPVPPPYRALTLYPAADPNGPYTSHGVWTGSTAYAVGDTVFPRSNAPNDYSMYYRCVGAGTSGADFDANNDGIVDPAEDSDFDGQWDEPVWPLWHGGIVEPFNEDSNRNGVLDIGEDSNGNGMLDVEPRWQAFRNIRPVRAIRIRVRFLHPTSGEMRQLTLMHSLQDSI